MVIPVATSGNFPALPALHINIPAILAAILAAMVLGFLWYGPLFGKAWAREMKLPSTRRGGRGSA